MNHNRLVNALKKAGMVVTVDKPGGIKFLAKSPSGGENYLVWYTQYGSAEFG